MLHKILVKLCHWGKDIGRFLSCLGDLEAVDVCEYLEFNTKVTAEEDNIMNIPLNAGDIPALMEALVSVMHKWKVLDVDECEDSVYRNDISLINVLNKWISKRLSFPKLSML